MLLSPLSSSAGTTAKPAKKIYDVATFLATTLTINYMVIPFQLLSWSLAMQVWSSFYFAPHVIAVAIYGVCMFLPKGPDTPAPPSQKKKL